MEIKITKRQKLLEINNEMCHNYYYLIYGRFINDEGTRCRKFKFVVWFDIFDVDEYFNYDDEHDTYIDNPITEEQIKEYLNECIWATVDMVSDYNNENQLQYFYEVCNDSITRYNQIARFW